MSEAVETACERLRGVLLPPPETMAEPAECIAHWLQGAKEMGIAPWRETTTLKTLRAELDAMQGVLDLMGTQAATVGLGTSVPMEALFEAAEHLLWNLLTSAGRGRMRYFNNVSRAVDGIRRETTRWREELRNGKGWPH